MMILSKQMHQLIKEIRSGPLFDLNGKVIGINTAIIAPGSSGSIGIGFAIPSNPASKVVEQLIKFGRN